jgi:hypothetical protein
MAGAPPTCQPVHLESMGTGSRQEGEVPKGRREARTLPGMGVDLALYIPSRTE